jgi:hypothetical protein
LIRHPAEETVPTTLNNRERHLNHRLVGLTPAWLAGRAVQSTTDRSGTSDRWTHWNIRHPTG